MTKQETGIFLRLDIEQLEWINNKRAELTTKDKIMTNQDVIRDIIKNEMASVKNR